MAVLSKKFDDAMAAAPEGVANAIIDSFENIAENIYLQNNKIASRRSFEYL